MSEVAAFRKALAEAGIVYVDAGVLALHLVGDARYLPLTRAILSGLRDGDFVAFTSAITIYQLLVEPYRSGQEARAERAEALIAALQGLEVVPVSATIARQAAQVKAQIGGGLPRAIQIATALAGDSELYVTRRSTLRRIAGLGVAQLDAYRQDDREHPAAET
ncbi:MAG: PIN domain-containing protein [marine benthic group bacterium]|nr:PIN domain-containing protein [Gemmatimonadota bacterium]